MKNRCISRETLIFLSFILLTILMTYPLAFNLGKAENLGDPLFISWNLAWDIHKLLTDPLHIFQANIFYPNPNALAYSEHLIGLALFSLPLAPWIHQPIIIYNVLTLLSFILSGYFTYCFGYHLTKHRLGSFIAGIVFAFFPYKIYQLGHLHVISTQWIPLAFLFLYKFFQNTKIKDLSLFIFFSLLQILTSGNLAIFFVISIAIFGAFLFIEKKGYKDRQLWIKLTFAAILCGIMLIPFYLPYLENQELMQFERSKTEIAHFSASIENYLASPSHLYQDLTSDFGKNESYLFLGICPILLALIGLLMRARQKEASQSKRHIPLTVLDIAIVSSFLVMLFTVVWGGFEFFLFDLKIKSHNFLLPWLTLVILLLLRKLLNKSQQPFILSPHFCVGKMEIFFLLLALLAVSFSLGLGQSTKFYNFFYNHLPGFKFVRVPARIGIFVSFFISLLVAYGAKRLTSFKIMRKGLFLAIPIILLEYASFPVRLYSIEKTPEVYQWLARQEGDFAIIELPIDSFWKNIRYVYHSTSHWKKLVNGYSGFFPPSDKMVQDAAVTDIPGLINYLQRINVKYLIAHRELLSRKQLEEIKSMKGELFLKQTFEGVDVYELDQGLK